jgi:hypothetical protein
MCTLVECKDSQSYHNLTWLYTILGIILCTMIIVAFSLGLKKIRAHLRQRQYQNVAASQSQAAGSTSNEPNINLEVQQERLRQLEADVRNSFNLPPSSSSSGYDRQELHVPRSPDPPLGFLGCMPFPNVWPFLRRNEEVNLNW